MDWYYASPEDSEKNPVVLAGDEWRHAFLARRHKVGDRIGLVDGRGRRGMGRVLHVAESRADVEVDSWTDDEREGGGPFVLAPALITLSRFEWVLEKGTEIGVHAFVPLCTERVQAGLAERAGSKLGRFAEITRAAMKQSGRSYWPSVSSPIGLEEFLGKEAECGSALVIAEESGFRDRLRLPDDRRIVGLVGPEGGFTSRELAEIDDREARAVALSFFRLRSETAALQLASRMVEGVREGRADQ